MGVHSICFYPQPILKVKTKFIPQLTKHHQFVIQHLIDTLKVQPGGIGIAAPQIGFSDRIAVVDVSPKEKSKKRLILVNPQIINREGNVTGREGCMSVPDYTGNVKRSSIIVVRWQDEEFKTHEMETDGLEAICIQHEVDHLDGYLFLDRVSSLSRDVFKRKIYLK